MQLINCDQLVYKRVFTSSPLRSGVDDQSGFSSLYTSPFALDRSPSRWPGCAADKNSCLRSTKFFSRWSVSVEQSVAGHLNIITDTLDSFLVGWKLKCLYTYTRQRSHHHIFIIRLRAWNINSATELSWSVLNHVARLRSSLNIPIDRRRNQTCWPTISSPALPGLIVAPKAPSTLATIYTVSKKGTPTLSIVTLKRISGFWPLLAHIFRKQLAIKWLFNFPPHLTSASTLPGENRTNEILLFIQGSIITLLK